MNKKEQRNELLKNRREKQKKIMINKTSLFYDTKKDHSRKNK